MHTHATISVLFCLFIVSQYSGHLFAAGSQQQKHGNAKQILSTFDATQHKPLSAVDLLADFKYLSSDALEGRKPGRAGHILAQQHIISRFKHIGLMPFNLDYRHDFVRHSLLVDKTGTNLIGWIEGNMHPAQYVVITAHYDHLGKQGGKIHPGADDNASGVSALLSIATSLKNISTHYSYLFVATDLEEAGLYGAEAFVAAPPVPITDIKLNINLDMLSQGGRKHLLYVAGSKKLPQLKSVINTIIEQSSHDDFQLKIGHESYNRHRWRGGDSVDWRKASDHYAFAKKQIPYLYFGVDTHKDYHQPSDTFASADKAFFVHAVDAVLSIVIQIDRQLLL